MKYTVALLLFLIGCTPKGGPEQMLRMKDGREVECRLLSVRPNGLVVDTSQPPAYHLTNAEIGLYPYESIDRFVYDPVSASKTIVLASASGLALGGLIGYLDGQSGGSGEGDVYTTPVVMTAYGLLGALSGTIIGALINEFSISRYDPLDPTDREQIAKLAIYRTSEEPDKLKKIK